MSNMDALESLALKCADVFIQRKLVCTTAESCTGGGLSALMTEIPGSSSWFERGFVTYSNQAKEDMLGVSKDILSSHGAVSEACAKAMAEGAINNSHAQISVAITGIAGPGGGSIEKPVGLVWIAWAGDFLPTYAQSFHFKGDRLQVRLQAMQAALDGLIKRAHPSTHPKVLYQGKERYFFALWPEPQVAHTLFKTATHIVKDPKALQDEDKLHLTLLYIGHSHPGFIERVVKKVDELQFNSFQLTINQVGEWMRKTLVWLGPDNTSIALSKFVSKLKNAIIPEGYIPERRSFMPHITITRQNNDLLLTDQIAPIDWKPSRFVLVQSVDEPKGGVNYRIVNSWSLS